MTRARTRSRTRGHSRVASAFSPLALSPSVWLRADLGVTHASNAVATWADQSGNGRSFTQGTSANRPTLQASGGPGGVACIDFDGTDDFVTGPVLNTGVITAAAFTLFVVFKADAIDTNVADGTAYNNDLVAGDSGGYHGLHLRSVPEAAFLNYDTGGKVVARALSTGTWYAAEARHESGTLYARTNATAEASIVSGNTGALTGSARLGRSFGAAHFDGQIAEVLWWARALTLPERTQVRD
jgi:hypothetical protein